MSGELRRRAAAARRAPPLNRDTPDSREIDTQINFSALPTLFPRVKQSTAAPVRQPPPHSNIVVDFVFLPTNQAHSAAALAAFMTETTFFLSVDAGGSNSNGYTSTISATVNDTVEIGPGPLKVAFAATSGQLNRVVNYRTGVSGGSNSNGYTSTISATVNDTVEIGPGPLKVAFAATSGQLNRVVNYRTGVDIQVQQSFLWYGSSPGDKQANQNSDAYIFRPDGAPPTAASASVAMKVIRGPLVDEVHQQFNSWINQENTPSAGLGGQLLSNRSFAVRASFFRFRSLPHSASPFIGLFLSSAMGPTRCCFGGLEILAAWLPSSSRELCQLTTVCILAIEACPRFQSSLLPQLGAPAVSSFLFMLA
ncbi:hypothetical protein KSP40_PGU009536 [Platanthera guangdongensis]|uniref:Glycosyl hydrolase family 38 C-terminal domain-containing protein n=1 Tax=Platanthera guangdongensis TaxID=2320717 RepID=A0ABR2MIX0_9ASPA